MCSSSRSVGRIQLFAVPNVYKLLQNYDRQNLKPLKLFTKFSLELLFQEKSSYRLHHLDCATDNPCLKKETIIGVGLHLKDMCLVTKKEGEVLICLFDGADGIYATNWSNQLLWGVEGTVGGKKEIKCVSVATDGAGNLFVCDGANTCIQLFSTDGLYIGCLVRQGEHGLGEPRLVRWCKKSSSLIVAHSKKSAAIPTPHGFASMSMYISVMKLTF